MTSQLRKYSIVGALVFAVIAAPATLMPLLTVPFPSLREGGGIFWLALPSIYLLIGMDAGSGGPLGFGFPSIFHRITGKDLLQSASGLLLFFIYLVVIGGILGLTAGWIATTVSDYFRRERRRSDTASRNAGEK